MSDFVSRDEISRDKLRKRLRGITLKEMIWDLKEELRNLDTRETLLQKTVARLEERFDFFLKGEEKKEERNRWKLAFCASILLWVLKLIVDFILECL